MDALREALRAESPSTARLLNHNRDNALICAVRAGSPECIKALLGACGDELARTVRPGTDDTPLHVCAQCANEVGEPSSVVVATVLLAAGADRSAKNAFGSRPRQLVPAGFRDLSEALFDPRNDLRVTVVSAAPPPRP